MTHMAVQAKAKLAWSAQLTRPAIAVVVASLLTGVVLWESVFPPWAPFFVVYAVLAIAVPLSTRGWVIGIASMRRFWAPALLSLIACLVIDPTIGTLLYERVLLRALGLVADPYYAPTAALHLQLERAAAGLRMSEQAVTGLFSLFILVWAPVAEELFYRGYLQSALRRRFGASSAILIASAFFGIRHATHLCYLWPSVPVIAALAWATTAFAGGLVFGCLYERTQTLAPVMVAHFLVNIIGPAVAG